MTDLDGLTPRDRLIQLPELCGLIQSIRYPLVLSTPGPKVTDPVCLRPTSTTGNRYSPFCVRPAGTLHSRSKVHGLCWDVALLLLVQRPRQEQDFNSIGSEMSIKFETNLITLLGRGSSVRWSRTLMTRCQSWCCPIDPACLNWNFLNSPGLALIGPVSTLCL